LELDPDFAAAHASLAINYRNLGEGKRAEESLKRAFALIGRVSEGERLFISSSYYMEVTREVDKAIETLELWKRTYPRSHVAPNNLGVVYGSETGQYEKALAEYQEAARLNSSSTLVRTNVGIVFLSLNRFGEARAVFEKAISEGMDSMTLRLNLFKVAFIQGDTATVAKQVEWAAGKPEEYRMLNRQSNLAEYLGQLRKARELRGRALDLIRRRKLTGVAASSQANEAVSASLRGDCRTAVEQVRAVLAQSRETAAVCRAAFALAWCGDFAQAQALAGEQAKEHPLDTLLHAAHIPAIQAAIELKRKQPSKVIDLLKRAIPYERAYPGVAYLRGLAHLENGAGKDAAAEFQSILDRKGAHIWSGFFPFAYVGLARAAALAGDTAKSRKTYEDFFALWKDADPDVAILIEARKEYANLK
jgi:tetratricopeptide (TPR) repeat protein